MTLHVKDGGAWKTVDPYVKDAGTWKPIQALYVRDAGTWKPVYERVTSTIVGVTFTTATSTFTVASGPTSITTSDGTVAITSNITVGHVITSTNGGVTCEAKFQRLIGGTWTDVGTTLSASSNEPIVDAETQERGYETGTISHSFTDTAGVGTHDYRVMVRRSSGTKTPSVSGSATYTP